MSRVIELARSEAELLTDLLMLSDSVEARDLSRVLRELFGMASEDRELRNRGMTKSQVRREWADRFY